MKGAINIRAGEWPESPGVAGAGCSIFAGFPPASSPGADSGPNLHLFERNMAQLFSRFFLFMFSNLLDFVFLFIANRKAVTPQGFPRTKLQYCCPLLAPAHGGTKIFAMCYIPTGAFILSQKLRPKATCWVIPAGKYLKK